MTAVDQSNEKGEKCCQKAQLPDRLLGHISNEEHWRTGHRLLLEILQAISFQLVRSDAAHDGRRHNRMPSRINTL